METIRIDLHKKKGRRPKYDIYIGRKVEGTEFNQSKWANPFLGIIPYKNYIINKIESNPIYYNIMELEGKILACWCKKGDFCHGDILIELINKERKILNKKREREIKKKRDEYNKDV